MKKQIEFWIKLIGCATLISYFIFWIVMPQYGKGYLASFADKVEREEEIYEPKIILMGDSNVAFGIDSQQMEEIMGRPVVNMGCHGGLGQAFCMDLAKKGIKEGDLVIVLPAHYKYSVTLPDGTLAWLLLENRKGLMTRVDKRDYPLLVRGFPAYLKRALTLWKNRTGNLEEPGIDRDDFNEFGDVRRVGNENVMEKGYLEEEFIEEVNQDLMEYYNEYSNYVKSKGAYMIIASGPIMEPVLNKEYDKAQKRQEKIKQALNFPVISHWKDYVYPKEYFYNTNYHLNDIGKDVRTQQLIHDIKDWEQKRDK